MNNNELSTILDRITKVMNMEGYNKKEFADKIGMHYSNFTDIMRGVRGVPSSLSTRIHNTFPYIRLEWLLWGDGEMYESEQRAAKVEALVERVTKVPTKPRLPVSAAAGKLSDYLDGVLASECEYLPIVRSLPDYDFTMMVKGNSMEPKFEGGDEIACKKVESVIEPGKTYVLATRDGAVLKRLYPDENGVRCVSYNSVEYPEFYVDKDNILDVYRVVGLIRI